MTFMVTCMTYEAEDVVTAMETLRQARAVIIRTYIQSREEWADWGVAMELWDKLRGKA